MAGAAGAAGAESSSGVWHEWMKSAAVQIHDPRIRDTMPISAAPAERRATPSLENRWYGQPSMLSYRRLQYISLARMMPRRVSRTLLRWSGVAACWGLRSEGAFAFALSSEAGLEAGAALAVFATVREDGNAIIFASRGR